MSLTDKYINRLNGRLLSFEKMGLTDSSQYQYLKEQINLLGIGTSGSKTRVSTTANDINALSNLLKVSTARQAMTKARQTMSNELGRKPTDAEVKEHINQTGKLESWVKENLDAIYELSKEIDEADFLRGMLTESGGLRKYSYSQIWGRIDEFEKSRREWENKTGIKAGTNMSKFMGFTDRFENDKGGKFD